MFTNLKNSAPFFFICYNKIKNVLSTCSYTLFTVHEKKYCHFSKKEQKKARQEELTKPLIENPKNKVLKQTSNFMLL